MLRSELIHSCSYAIIADAALRSIGYDFKTRVQEAAAHNAVEAGAFAARLVREFSQQACEEDLQELGRTMASSDMPLLRGFRYIVEYMLSENDLQQKAPIWAQTNGCADARYSRRFENRAA